jgi:hypothetical protein
MNDSIQRAIKELETEKRIIDAEIAKETLEVEAFVKRAKDLQNKRDNVDNLSIAISRLKDFLATQEDEENKKLDAWGDIA